jgi:hypothetical protein
MEEVPCLQDFRDGSLKCYRYADISGTSRVIIQSQFPREWDVPTLTDLRRATRASIKKMLRAEQESEGAPASWRKLMLVHTDRTLG